MEITLGSFWNRDPIWSPSWRSPASFEGHLSIPKRSPTELSALFFILFINILYILCGFTWGHVLYCLGIILFRWVPQTCPATLSFFFKATPPTTWTWTPGRKGWRVPELKEWLHISSKLGEATNIGAKKFIFWVSPHQFPLQNQGSNPFRVIPRGIFGYHDTFVWSKGSHGFYPNYKLKLFLLQVAWSWKSFISFTLVVFWKDRFIFDWGMHYLLLPWHDRKIRQKMQMDYFMMDSYTDIIWYYRYAIPFGWLKYDTTPPCWNHEFSESSEHKPTFQCH